MRLRLLATAELLLIFPAALFMTALVLRSLQPIQYEPAHTAQQLVLWYVGRMWSLWVLLLALPFIALVTGCAVLLYNWKQGVVLLNAFRQSLVAIRAHLAVFFIAVAILAAGGILAIVVLHMAAN